MNPPPLPKPVPAKKQAGPVAIILTIGFLVLFLVALNSEGDNASSSPPATAPAAKHPVAVAPVAAAPDTVSTVSAAPPAAPAAPEARRPNVFARREALEKKALGGNYQAQRNLAYSLGSEFPADALKSCAWRIVILNSGSSDVDDSDLGNRHAACERKLSPEGIYAAELQAITLGEAIEARRK